MEGEGRQRKRQCEREVSGGGDGWRGEDRHREGQCEGECGVWKEMEGGGDQR